ncbi:hypothetical protein EAF04_008577 [Stromatinia cepivora]|nr:hypothetical protein EAF04_008577 [Stromatinia cepivora]
MGEQVRHETTSPCRGRFVGRSLGLVTDLAPPHQQPCHSHYFQNPQNPLNPAYSVSASTLSQYNQINSLSALPLTQNHLFAAPQPQPYQTQPLNPEHHYLLLSLSRENLKALALRQKIAAAEASLSSLQLASGVDGPGIATPHSAISNPPTPISTQLPTRRKLKKQLSWLKCRTKECARQERIITERLHQIGEEEQRRWRWMQIERQTRINEEMLEWQRGYWDSFVRGGAAAGFGHGVGYGHRYAYGYGQGGVHLNANTPAFQPVASGFGAHGSGSQRSSVIKYSNEFWNTEAPVFSPVNFFAASSSSQNSQEVERLSRGWDECDLSPLAEERAGSSEEWTTELGGDGEAEEKGEVDDETETGEGSGSGSGEGEGGDSATETAITTPTPQQSARMTPMGGAKSCNDVKLVFCDGTWGFEEGCMDVGEGRGDTRDWKDRNEGKGKRPSFLRMKDEVLSERKSKSLPGMGSKRLIEVYVGKEEGKGKAKEEENGEDSLKERNEVDQVW